MSGRWWVLEDSVLLESLRQADEDDVSAEEVYSILMEHTEEDVVAEGELRIGDG